MKLRKYRLEEVCNLQIGKTPRREIKDYWGKGYSWVSISDMKSPIIDSTKEEITEMAVNECGCKLIPKGTILLSFKLSIGKLAYAGKDLFTNEAIVALGIKDSHILHQDYLYYVLKNIPLVGSNNAAMGSTLNKESLRILRLPIPEDISDQFHIANILTKAEKLIAHRKESIRLLDEFLKSIFLEMFDDPEKNKNKFPFTELEKLCSEIVDCPHSTPVKSKGITNYPCIRTSELEKGYIDWNSMQYLEEEEYLVRVARLVPQSGDIVYGREGTYGDAIIIPKTHKFSLGQRTMLFRPDYKKTNSIFLWAMVRSDFVYRQAKKKNSGSTVGHVNVKDIRQFRLLNPPIELQNAFAQIVEKTESLKTQYQQSLQELENLYGSLSQRAFRGELRFKEEGMMIAAEPEAPYSVHLLENISE